MLGGASALSTTRRYKGVLFATPLFFSEAHDYWNVIPLRSSVDRFTISSIQKAQKDQDFPHFSGDMFYNLLIFVHNSESSSGNLLFLRFARGHSTRQDGYPRNLPMFAQRTFFSADYLAFNLEPLAFIL
jgi:hypothetical protein